MKYVPTEEFCYPLHIRQMKADAQHSPRKQDAELISEEIVNGFTPVEYREYLKGDRQ